MELESGEGYYGHLTSEQQATLANFKKEIVKLNSKEWKYNISQFDDYDYLRFLRARQFDLNKAIEMFTKYIKWRIDFGVDNILLFKFPELSVVKKIYPHGYHKTDKKGRPIYIERIGMLNLDELFKKTNQDRLIKYYVREYEKMRNYIYPACCSVAGKKIETGFTILDLAGGSSSLLSPSCYSFVKIASNICQDYYPETLGVMFVVNCSWVLQTGWYIIRAFLDSKTRNKIQILGGSYKDKLLEHVSAENLPEFLGGTCNCKPHGCMNQPEGPWKEYYSKFPSDDNEKDLKYPPAPAKWVPK